jgi:glyoxylase-like metal-dependent hydrolase (beta-lactamase superfamily II)
LLEEKVLIGGDVLFAGSIGRTDLPGCDHQALISNIKNKLYLLPDETQVLPGHGPSTTIGEEKRHNPFVRG